jgi:hypothetical protein
MFDALILVLDRIHRALAGERARLTRVSSQTGSEVSRTMPSEPKTRKRSKVRANQRSWVTASTVPS